MELAEPLQGVTAYIGIASLHAVAQDRRLQSQFSFRLPPGEYLIGAYGQHIDFFERPLNLLPSTSILDLGKVNLQTRGNYKPYFGKMAPSWKITDARGLDQQVKLSDLRGKWMLSNIPSWVIAIIGPSIIIVSTIISSISLYKIRGIITDKKNKIEKIRREKDNLWRSHQQGDQRSRDAEIFLALLKDSITYRTTPVSNVDFLVDRTAYYLRGAILSMLAASGATREEFSKTEKEVDNLLEDFFRTGNPKAYEASLTTKIDTLRRRSADKVNELAGSVSHKESQILSHENKEYVIYLAYVFLNLFGLALTMCKDLPIWRKQNN